MRPSLSRVNVALIFDDGPKPERKEPMTTTAISDTQAPGMTGDRVRELDHRTGDGGDIDVWLLWDGHTDRVSVAVEDHRLGHTLAFEIDPTDAVPAFHHPYAYAAATRTSPAHRTQETTTERTP